MSEPNHVLLKTNRTKLIPDRIQFFKIKNQTEAEVK